MELFREELPLTEYFPKVRRQSKPDNRSRKRRRSATEDISNGGVPSKSQIMQALNGGLEDASARFTVSGSPRHVKIRANQARLPTPETSSRRRGHPCLRLSEDGSPKSRGSRTALAGKSAAKKQPAVLCEIDLTQSDSENVPLIPVQQSGNLEAEPAGSSPSLSPSSDAKHRCTSHTTPNTSIHLPTPATVVRKALATVPTSVSPESSPTTFLAPKSKLSLTRDRTLNPKCLQGELLAANLLPPKSTCSRTLSGDPGILHADEDNNPFSAPADKFVDSEKPGVEHPRKDFDVVTPRSMLPDVRPQLVSSSQSQYLVHLEATPKRKRNIYLDDVVSCSQSDENELCVATPPRLTKKGMIRTPTGKKSVGGDGRSPMRTSSKVSPHPGGWKGVPDHKSRLDSVSQQVTPSHGSSRSCHNAKRKKSPSFFPSSPPRKQTSSYRSRTDSHSSPPRTLVRQDSIDIPADLGDESATEPESDTDILHCVAAIGQRRGNRMTMPSPVRSPSHPFVSPLLSPSTRQQITEASCTLGGLAADGAGLSVPGTYTSHDYSRVRISRRTDRFSSVARDFMDMFRGDGSYPDDFPESLRM